MGKAEQVEVQNVNVPGHVARVDAVKYRAMRECLLRVLPKRSPGMTQKQMQEAVKDACDSSLWPNGEKSGWWAKTVQLDLEAKGIVQRETDQKPLRWYLA
ncbi:MAG: hypothetical protein AAGF84_10940 [Planctomycetota bacterium]